MKNERIEVTGFGGPERLRRIEEELPRPGVGEARVRVLASGVSFADLLMREGVHPERRRPPFTLGWDLIGEVESLGDGAQRVSVGDIVAALPIRGGYSRYLCLPESELVGAPPDVDPAAAVCLVMDYVVGYQMLHRSVHLEAGRRILVHGASGGCGTALLQLGALLGLRMQGTASAGNHDHVRRFGGEPIDYRSDDFVERARRVGRVHAVFDGVGGSNLFRSYRCLLRGGRLVFYGMTSALRQGSRGRSSLVSSVAYPAGVLALNLWPDGRGVRLYSIQMRKRRHPEDFRRDLEELLRLLSAGEISPVVARCFELRQAAEAHAWLAKKAAPGKVVLLPSRS